MFASRETTSFFKSKLKVCHGNNSFLPSNKFGVNNGWLTRNSSEYVCSKILFQYDPREILWRPFKNLIRINSSLTCGGTFSSFRSSFIFWNNCSVSIRIWNKITTSKLCIEAKIMFLNVQKHTSVWDRSIDLRSQLRLVLIELFLIEEINETRQKCVKIEESRKQVISNEKTSWYSP